MPNKPLLHFCYSLKKPQKIRCGDASFSGFIKNGNYEFYLLMVADGVSKAPKDYLASATTIDTIAEYLENQPIITLEGSIKQAILNANTQLFTGVENTFGMLSTLSIMVYDIVNNKIYLANIGDSRIFGYNGASWQVLTTDDAQKMPVIQNGKQIIQNGAPLYHWPLTKAIGGVSNLEFEITEINIQNYYGFALASDGFYELPNFITWLQKLYHAGTPVQLLGKHNDDLLLAINDDASISMLRLAPPEGSKVDFLTFGSQFSKALFMENLLNDLELAINKPDSNEIVEIIQLILEAQIIEDKAVMIQLLEKMMAINAKEPISLITAYLRKM